MQGFCLCSTFDVCLSSATLGSPYEAELGVEGEVGPNLPCVACCCYFREGEGSSALASMFDPSSLACRCHRAELDQSSTRPWVVHRMGEDRPSLSSALGCPYPELDDAPFLAAPWPSDLLWSAAAHSWHIAELSSYPDSVFMDSDHGPSLVVAHQGVEHGVNRKREGLLLTSSCCARPCIHMTPLRILSPAPDSPEYSSRGSEEASSSSDESCPPCELGEGNILRISDGGIAPYDSESPHEILDPCTVDGVVVPETLSRGEDVTPLALSSDESPLQSSMRPSGCQNTPWRTSLPKLSPKKVLKKALSEAENFLVQVFDQRLKEGRLWDVNMKHSLSSLQWAGIVSGSPDISCPKLELSSSSFLSVGGGGSVRSHGPSDDDVKSYVGSEEAELRTPPLQDLIGIQSLDETEMLLASMTKGRRLQLPSAAFVRGGRGRRGIGGRGRPDSPDRARVNTRDFDDRDRRNSRDAEDRHPKPPTELTREKEVASDYLRESQKRRQLTGPIDFQDLIGSRESVVPLGGLAFGSSLSVTPASYAKEQFKYEMVKNLEKEIAGLRELHKELSDKYDALQDSVRHLEASEEGKTAIIELSRPSTKAGYNMAYHHFASYLSEVPADKKWDGLPWPHDDIGVTNQNIPYYIANGPPPLIVKDAEEEGEPGEVNIVDP
ncbi:hypothetical protein Dimus_020978 [Dionaea muscipula]